jgi:hypothetical protein
MGLVQDVHAAVTRYEDGTRATLQAVTGLATTVAALGEEIAAHGPLGTSTDPDLVRARERLAAARGRLLAAGEAAAASRGAARVYADRAFPV